MSKKRIVAVSIFILAVIAIIFAIIMLRNKPIKLEMSEWSYSSVIRLNNDRYLVTDDKVSFFIDKNGTKIEDLKDEKGNAIANSFDSYRDNLQDGAIALTWKENDKYKVAIFDKEMKCIKSFDDAQFIDYRYDIFEIFRGEKYCIYNFEEKGISNSGRYYLGPEYIKASNDKIYSYKVSSEGIELGEGLTFTQDGMDVSPWNGSVTKEGWFTCSLRENKETKNTGFYNIKTKEFVEMPNGISSARNFYGIDGNNTAVVLDGVAVLKVNSEGDGTYRAFSLEKKDYITEEYEAIYRYEGKQSYYLTKYSDDKYGFVDKNTYQPVGEKYDDASSFCNGVAMITNNGETYLVNEKFEKISEALTGIKAAHCVTDSYSFSVLGDEAVFMAKDQNDKYHVITVDVSKIK